MVVALRSETSSFQTEKSYRVERASASISYERVLPHVGEFIAVYEDISPLDLDATDPEMDAFLADSKVVSVKPGL